MFGLVRLLWTLEFYDGFYSSVNQQRFYVLMLSFFRIYASGQRALAQKRLNLWSYQWWAALGHLGV